MADAMPMERFNPSGTLVVDPQITTSTSSRDVPYCAERVVAPSTLTCREEVGGASVSQVARTDGRVPPSRFCMGNNRSAP